MCNVEVTLMDLSGIRIKEHFGIVTNNTRTSQFTFLLSPPRSRGSIEKQDYVLVDHPLLGEACQVIGVIQEIASDEEVTGPTLGERIGKMVATTEVVGYVDLRGKTKPMHPLFSPVNPGSRVYVPSANFMEDVLNRNLKGEPFAIPLFLGKINASLIVEVQNQNQINFFVDAQDLMTKHTLIAGMAGAGKTHMAKILIQELSNKTKMPLVVLDNSGDYTNFQPSESKVSILAANPEKVAKTLTNQTTQVKGMSEKIEKEGLAKEVKAKRILVLNGEGLTAEEERPFYRICLKTLLKNRADETIEKFFLVVERAEDLKGEALDQMMTQGQKNGINICLVSSHCTDLGGHVLSKVGNQIVGKTADKDDVEYLTSLISAGSGVLQHLAVGEWIINGVNRSRSVKVQATDNLTIVDKKNLGPE